jgi:hypothetical protein
MSKKITKTSENKTFTKATTQENNATQVYSKHITSSLCEKTCSMNNPFQVGSQINLTLVIIIPTD